jgi:hypothetical protein
MQHYVGLDVSVKETSVCIVDKAGKVIREVKVATKPPVSFDRRPCPSSRANCPLPHPDGRAKAMSRP